MSTISRAKKDAVVLTINGEFLERQQEDKLPRSYAYVFTDEGHLLGREKLDDKGSARVSVPAGTADRELQVFVGPEVRPIARDEDDQTPRAKGTITIGDVIRRGAEGQYLTLKGGAREAAVSVAVLPDRWQLWLTLGFCVVRGKLLKGVPGPDRPIPNATVEIYEVDPIHILIPKLPIEVIQRIRDFLIDPPIDPDRLRIKPRIPIPPVPPEPGPFPSPAMRFDAQGFHTDADDLTPVTNGAQAVMMLRQNAPVLGGLKQVALSGSDLQLKQALTIHPSIVKLLLCLISPPAVWMTLVATATTNKCGEFKAIFWNGISNPDQPDLYFKAKQKVIPWLPPLTIYAPTPIPCYTYWDYACGTEVTLISTHPLAVTGGLCDIMPPDKGVLVNRIGSTYVGNILGATGAPFAAPADEPRRGLWRFDAYDRPLGGTLWFQLAFDYSHMVAQGVKYYRLSWARRPGGGGVPAASDFTAIKTPIKWYKRFSVSQDPVEVHIGPQPSTDNLYEIQPQSLPSPFWWDVGRGQTLYHAIFATDVSDVAEGTGWTPAYAPNGTDKAGKFLIKIELFDAAQNKVNLTTKQIGFWIGKDGTVNTQEAAHAAAIHDNSFILTLHVDNNRCLADVNSPWLNVPSNTANPDCGMLEYALGPGGTKLGTVHVPYKYGHRNGFATWVFSVSRGAGVPVGSESTPALASNTAQGAQTGDFNRAVSDMLGSCNAAAYVAKADVDALAFDGSGRLYLFDAYDDFAFGLMPNLPMSGS